MGPLDYAVNLVLSVVLIVGAYQFYFWCQRHPLWAPREFARAIDEAIPLRPHWVWVYSFLYYPAILAVNLAVDDHREFAWTALSYLLLLGVQMAFFILYPVATPAHWRLCNPHRTLSERLLALVQRFDAPTNSFPSMHTSVAMLTALHLDPVLGTAAIAFPLPIGASCVLTKQHYLIDVPAGAALGWAVFGLVRTLAA